jgi:hypothetical protein
MKRISLLVVAVLIALPVVGQGFAVAPKISTLGYGADLIVGLGSYVQLRGGATTGSITREMEQSDITYDGEADFSTINLFLDIYPVGGPFRFTIGGIRNESSFEGRSIEGTVINLNGTPYPVSQVGQIRAIITPEETGPYAGIGFGNVLSRGSRFRFMLDLGAHYHGEPKISLIAQPNPGVPLPPRFEQDLAAEEASAQEEIRGYKIYPVVSFSFAFRF